jgi:hypothetical protein
VPSHVSKGIYAPKTLNLSKIFGWAALTNAAYPHFPSVSTACYASIRRFNTNRTNIRMKRTKQKDTPAHEIRLGSVKAAILRNEHENGVRYNTTFSRLYRDEQSWKSSDSFGRDDLLVLGKVADLAHPWIFAQSQTQPSQSQTEPN